MSEHSKRPSATKSGSGRYHSNGHQKSSLISPAGAPREFVLHQASPAKTHRRELISAHGRRQAIKALKYWRAEDREAKKLEAGERAAYIAPDAEELTA